MTDTKWALILGASSGFGEATALELARHGFDIYGVHLDRRETLPHAEQVQRQIRDSGRQAVFFNGNAAADEKRAEVIARIVEDRHEVRVLLHSLAFGALKPLAGAADVASKRQLEMTADVMGHSLVYWARDLVAAGAMRAGGRIYAMTSEGGAKAIPEYGPVCAAKAILEAHIRQLALELAPLGITANAILAGVTDTPALRKIPGNEKLMDFARARNPHHRLTTPADVARCIAVLCHPGTAWMTGNTLRVDGGEGSVG
ncbi:MAG: SDR family oxidoreductase [Candidatus Solibacter usitatus]|nr:SDR family oxidoreductase [Candidatus Solibacter usitatus]